MKRLRSICYNLSSIETRKRQKMEMRLGILQKILRPKTLLGVKGNQLQVEGKEKL
jgi:hypothetical protein